MGMIGRWIDEKCRREPEVMRHVLNRSFGPLNKFLSDGKCGCLVGSYALIRNDPWVDDWEARYQPPRGHWWYHPWRRDRIVGIRVSRLCYLKGNQRAERKRPDEFVVRLLKQRIRRSLGLAPVQRPEATHAAVEVA